MDVSFTQMRRDYLARRFPQLDEPELAAIADTTTGYTFEMLDRAVPSRLEGKLVELTPLAPCVNPESGIVQERLVDPIALTRELEGLGFRTHLVLPMQWDPKTWLHGGGSWKGFWARVVVRMIWPTRALRTVLLQRMDHFIVVGSTR